MKISLKGLRVNANLTQLEVADKLGVTKETISNWENGKTSPDAVMLLKLCGVYKCSLDSIFLPDKLAKSELD